MERVGSYNIAEEVVQDKDAPYNEATVQIGKLRVGIQENHYCQDLVKENERMSWA